MRRILFIIPLVVALAPAQTMTEMGASAAGSAIGSAAGKKISDGITAIFGKVDKSTAKAAKPQEDESKSAPLLEAEPATPRSSSRGESVPPPPPPAGWHRSAPKPVVETMPEIPPPPPPPPAPPLQMTAADLKQITTGMHRQDVLKLGEPSSRITMPDDGHLFEIFSYADKDAQLGRVHLTDGAVSSVEVQ